MEGDWISREDLGTDFAGNPGNRRWKESGESKAGLEMRVGISGSSVKTNQKGVWNNGLGPT